MRSLLLSICFILPLLSWSQTDLLLGEWKAHLPYNIGNQVAAGNGKVFIGSNSGIIVIDEEDIENPLFYTKVNGLNDINVDKIAFDNTNGQLAIAYNNSVVDLFSPEGTFTIRDIEKNSDISGSKKINDIHISKDGIYMYLSAGFGILQYDLSAREFGFNTFTSENVFRITSHESMLFAATESGCYFLDLNSSANENFFGDWTLLDETNGLNLLYESKLVEVFGSKIVLTVDDKVYVSSIDELQFTEIYEFDDASLEAADLASFKDGWMLTLFHPTGKSELVFFSGEGELLLEDTSCSNVSNGAVEDSKGRIWIGDNWRGIRYKNGMDGSCTKLQYPGPFASPTSEVVVKNNEVFVATGGVNDNFTANFSRDGFYILSDNEWEVINETNTNFILENDVLSFFRIRPHPIDDLVYVGSYWAGLLQYNRTDKSFKLFDKDNTGDSGLAGAIGDEERTRISAMAFDLENNLWMANFGTEKPLVVYTKEGIWHHFELQSSGNISELIIDDVGYIWMVVTGNDGGVLIYDTGGSLEDPTDDQQRFIRNSNLPRGNAITLTMDLSGDVWLGTTEGALVFECGPSAFNIDVCQPNHPQVVQDGIRARLLQTEIVKSIMVDGANRKWFGTQNGVFIQSPDTEEQIAHFTIDNSPLLDNDIFDIGYNEETGEAYLATAKGIVTYRSKATGASRNHSSSIYAFPNPVQADYQGPIAIKGLATDANVKITDLNGRLVFETTALGGQAIWDGTHFDDNSKAAAGVYLVFSSTTDVLRDPNTHVTKILLMR